MTGSVAILRRKRVWIPLALFAVYTLFGFLIAPRLVEQQVVGTIATRFGRTASLETVRVNPLVLSLALRGFRLDDPDGQAFVAFDELYVDFQVSSLVRRAYTFKQVRLDNPHVLVRLMPDERPNFHDMIPAPAPASAPAAEPAAPPRLVVGLLAINGARLRAANLASPQPEEVAFTPVDFALNDFTTLPNRDGTYTLGATGHGGGRWSWTGALTVEPLRSEGTFVLEGEQLRPLWDVVKNRVDWEISDGTVDLRLDYLVEMRPDTTLASITNAEFLLTRFAFREKDRDPMLLAIDSLRVSGIEVAYPAATVGVARVAIDGPRARAWLTADSTFNWLTIARPPAVAPSGVRPADTGTEAPAAPPAAAPAWSVRVTETVLTQGALMFTDSTTTPPFTAEVTPVNVTVRNVSNEPGARFDVSLELALTGGGTFSAQGTVAPNPLTADATVDLAGLPLAMFQPYVTPRARLELVSGTLDARGDVTVRATADPARPGVTFRGEVSSRDLLCNDTLQNERFLSWASVRADRVACSSSGVQIAAIDADGFYGHMVVKRDRTTNLAEVFGIPPRDTSAAPRPAAEPKPPTLPVQIDVIRVKNSSMDFADYSLVLPFAAGIKELNGDITGLSSERLARAIVTLDGTMKPAGIATVRGEINPLSGDLYTNLSVMFRDFDLPSMSPYSGQYLGRKIDQGKLLLDLRYQVSNRQLLGENKIVMDQLELGEDVESPEATSLPVGLAIALLKNREGQIDLDIPVKGDLDDPKFSIRDVIFDVIVNILVKAVTAPFSLLGKLVGFGGGDEELSQVHFDPGSPALSAAEKDKVLKLAEALGQRPNLRLEVRGSANPDVDGAAIREARFVSAAGERARRDPGKYAPAADGSVSPRLIRDLYEAQFGKEAREALTDAHRKPKLDKNGNPTDDMVPDEAAFTAAARAALVEAMPVAATELQVLAQSRSAAIKSVLVTDGLVTDERIFLQNVDEQGQVDEGRVRIELKLAD